MEFGIVQHIVRFESTLRTVESEVSSRNLTGITTLAVIGRIFASRYVSRDLSGGLGTLDTCTGHDGSDSVAGGIRRRCIFAKRRRSEWPRLCVTWFPGA